MPLKKLSRQEFSARIGSFIGEWVRNKNGRKLEFFSEVSWHIVELLWMTDIKQTKGLGLFLSHNYEESKDF